MMKKSVLTVLFSAALLCAQDDAAQGQAAADTNTTKTTKSTKTSQASQPQASGIANSIPKDAEPLGQGRYRAVDAGGVAWIYQKTPFGITRTRESEAASKAGQSSPFGGPMQTRQAASKPDGPVNSVTAFPRGDEIRFEKESPFGKSVWTKKRTDELNDVEKSALAKAEKATAANGKN